MLGPLEVIKDGRSIALGGTKQRATLAYLLLNANRVVPTSELLNALWAEEKAPATARKILQNSVWGLRRALAAHQAGPWSEILVTKTPGYMIQVDPDQVDLHVFHQQTAEGRAALEAGFPDKAARTLKGALDLWQGQALTDLAEAGFRWPQLTAAGNTRLDTIEDHFEAELQCGRHQSTLGALESMVESEPLRERMCGQLMLALYRCGRQADALDVYGRLRTLLIDNLGLEPRRELQALQHAILNHDAGLSPSGPSPSGPSVSGPSVSGPSVSAEGDAGVRSCGASTADREAAEPGADFPEPVARATEMPAPPHVVALPPPSPAPAVATAPTGTRRVVSVLLLRLDFGPAPEASPSGENDDLRDGMADRVRGLVAAFDGAVIGSLGSTHLAVFDALDSGGNHAWSAVRAAMAIRNELHAKGSSAPLSRPGQERCGPTLHAAVATGEACLRYGGSGDTGAGWSADGEPLDESQFLLGHAESGEILVCGKTRQMTASAVYYDSAGDIERAWKATEERTRFPGVQLGPADREVELDVLHGLWHRVRHHGTPHVVTVLGGPNTGKSQLLKEFERRILDLPIPPRFLSYSVPCQSPGRLYGAEALAELVGLLDREVLSGGSAEPRPVVIAIDDLHLTDETLLDYVGNVCGGTASGPVFVVTTARPELFRRRPAWGGGMSLITSLSLDPPALFVRNVLRDTRLGTSDAPGRGGN
ncbi:winged helix-turn-helix domain-containing protein [Streptomyces sp. NBC_01381]|uniref:BTAD domain-containing putative transcriptional regulator n=1 Tax=Streptomyces sp. NBC_01381 TaxID=2903845 RepID=UPI0022567257|nr:BTAD domain-containing putative transcriptional regulator [Streptomyces sp. NBC_01381]MCX4673484.1 winged helix-turn-helix domain-containing protein [Streptomyces sp. NBC_01381]